MLEAKKIYSKRKKQPIKPSSVEEPASMICLKIKDGQAKVLTGGALIQSQRVLFLRILMILILLEF